MQDAHRFGIREGMRVVASDGQDIGAVLKVDLTERGVGPETGILLVETEGNEVDLLAIPFSVVRGVEGEAVLLDLPARDAYREKWGGERERRPL